MPRRWQQLGDTLLCPLLQGTREVEMLVFKMTSELGKVKRKIDMLGTAKDTVQHRSVKSDRMLRSRDWLAV